MEFKEKLRLLKQAKEVTSNKELAEKLNLTTHAIDGWVRKKEIPSKYLLIIDESKKKYIAPREEYQKEINRILEYICPKATYYMYHQLKDMEAMDERFENYFEIDKKFDGMPNS